jgi:hypothetical protein
MNSNFIFSSTIKRTSFALICIGILAFVYGFITHVEPQRIWANVLVNSFFFMAISLGATFFIAMNYAAEAGWGVVVKRVFEAVSSFLPIGGLLMLIVFIGGALHFNHIYEWMDPKVIEEDKIIAAKSPYLNIPFFFIRALVYFGVWIYFQQYFRKQSIMQDKLGGTEIHFKTFKMAAIFLVFFAVSSSTSAWDWIMSIDTHWYSTLFGWYVFSGMWVSAMIVIVLLTIFLKRNNYLQNVTEDHIHDLGKWMFAISFLWSYLWFSQFMLIWYSDIPEEVTYFVTRLNHYKFIFFGMFFINFVFPMLILMSRDAKRNFTYLTIVGLIIFIGHWLDVFVLIMPGVVGEHWSIGAFEIGLFLGFLGLFSFVVFREMAKVPLEIKHHPYLDESIHHHQ